MSCIPDFGAAKQNIGSLVRTQSAACFQKWNFSLISLFFISFTLLLLIVRNVLAIIRRVFSEFSALRRKFIEKYLRPPSAWKSLIRKLWVQRSVEWTGSSSAAQQLSILLQEHTNPEPQQSISHRVQPPEHGDQLVRFLQTLHSVSNNQ